MADIQKTLDEGRSRAMQIIRTRVLDALKATAFDLNEMTHTPVWTHNLWDSVGCGVYENGVLIEYAVPGKIAHEPRSGADEFYAERIVPGSEQPIWTPYEGVDIYRAHWGYKELFDMLFNPPDEIRNLQGWALYYVAAMPYAEVKNHEEKFTHEKAMQPLFFTHIRKP